MFYGPLTHCLNLTLAAAYALFYYFNPALQNKTFVDDSYSVLCEH